MAHHLSAVALLPPLPPIFGNLGVTFFFVLSGFILARNYHGRLNVRGDLTDFWRARFARVWPLHAATLVVAVIFLATAGAPVVLDRLILNGALLHAWVPDEGVYFSFNGPAWSISVEATFYLLFPAIVGSPGTELEFAL